MQALSKITRICALVFLVLAILCSCVLIWFDHSFVKPALNGQEKFYDRIKPLLEADNQEIFQDPVLWKYGKNADAAPFLRAKFKSTSLTPMTESYCRDNPGKWLTNSKNAPVPNLDTAWITELRNFDFMNASGEDALFAKNQTHFLKCLASLHVVNGLRKGDILFAVQDIQHLASLFYSTEIEQGALTSLILLQLSNSAIYQAKAIGITQNKLVRIPDERLRQAKRVLMTMTGGFSVTASKEFLLSAYSANHFRYGLCAGIAEGIKRHTQMPGLLFRNRHNAEKLGLLNALVNGAQNKCRLVELRKLWATPKDSLPGVNWSFRDKMLRMVLSLPVFGKIIQGIFLSMVSPKDWYER